MEQISKDSTLDNYIEWLEKMGFECKKTSDSFLSIKKNSISIYMAKMASENIIFMLAFDLQEGFEEVDVLRKVNSVNKKLLSGCIAYDQENSVITYTFSLVKPFGMGYIGFSNFVDYSLQMVGFMLDELKLSEITK